MAEAVIVEFRGVDPDLYDRVNAALGIDMEAGTGEYPEGMLHHTAASEAQDQVLVFEVWESQAHQEKFMNERLVPAFQQAGAPQPTRITWMRMLGHHDA
jgi:quinol monooxygenase YgiN